MVTLKEEHKKVLSGKDEELERKDNQLVANAKAIAEKDVVLLDMGYQHALLVRTLYGFMQAAAVKEVALRGSLVPAEGETCEEKALLTQADLVGHIRVLEDDCLATF